MRTPLTWIDGFVMRTNAILLEMIDVTREHSFLGRLHSIRPFPCSEIRAFK